MKKSTVSESDKTDFIQKLPNRLPLILLEDKETGFSPVPFPFTSIQVNNLYNKRLADQFKKEPSVLIGHVVGFDENNNDKPIVFQTGVLAFVSKIMQKKDRLIVKADLAFRAKLKKAALRNSIFTAEYKVLEDQNPSPDQFTSKEFQEKMEKMLNLLKTTVKEMSYDKSQENTENFIKSKISPTVLGPILDQLSHGFNVFVNAPAILKYLKKMLAEINVERRLDYMIEVLEKIQNKPEEIFSEDTQDSDEDNINPRFKIYEKNYQDIKDKIPNEARQEIERELTRLKYEDGPGDVMIQDHIDTLLKLFTLEETQDNTDIIQAKKILDEDHFGLKVPKERVLEYLAVHENPKKTVNILCFVGPPGVGKTSLGRSIARAQGKKFVRFSLGGLRDEAEIRGHGLTYIRTFPGQIIKGIMRSGSNNPVFMLDEIDKMSGSFRDDPASALLEVLDPEQNNEFRDINVNVPFDLSQVFFICTANTTHTIPPALLDRLEIIKLSGYTPYEKLAIAKNYLINKARSNAGIPFKRGESLAPQDISFSDRAILKIIEEYTNEAGVRQLERVIVGICRKVVLKSKTGEYQESGEIKITTQNLHTYGGKPIIYPEHRFEKLPFGCVPMFAVSETGGHFLYIEVVMGRHREDRKIKVTGVRGSEISKDIINLIEESTDVALDSLIMEGGILHETTEKLLQEGEFYIHVHINDMASPKDGPSAGIPLLYALYGCLTKQSIQPNLGATGEIDLRLGNIGTVGGIREKSIAAHRAGIKKFVIPQDNERDLDEVPPEIKEQIEFLPRRYWWDALMEAFPGDELIKAYSEKRRSE